LDYKNIISEIMKRIRVILPIVACLILFSYCNKYLEIEDPQNISSNDALTSDENVKSVLVGAYSQLANFSVYGGDLLRNAELLSGNGEILYVGTLTDPRDMINKTMVATNADVNNQWYHSYAVINTVNNVLSAIEVVNEADRNSLEGQALFLRGMTYFDLVRFYAQQYQPGVPNTQMGVPLILTPTLNINDGSFVKRNSVEEIYDQVIADLTTASGKLAEDNGVYASSGAANALLARVYLQKGDFEKARDASNKVIQSEFYSLVPDYAALFNNDKNSAEDIFEVQITSPDESEMTSFFSVQDYGGRNDIEILPGHLDLYPTGDKRKDLFFFAYGAWRSGKWNNRYGLISLLRLADMYLIRAECNIRLGMTTGASPLDDFNAVHTRAGLAAAESITLDDILFERRLEFSFEGIRIHDVRRLHENVASYPYDDPKMVFPIPARELEANPSLRDQQNSGY
jgi:tetratricopeptide (TPR) repeat protein